MREFRITQRSHAFSTFRIYERDGSSSRERCVIEVSSRWRILSILSHGILSRIARFFRENTVAK